MNAKLIVSFIIILNSYVAAASLTGEHLWASEKLDGLPCGTPVVSSDGQYVFLTHNSNSSTVGHFTILDGNNSGAIFHNETNSTSPFAPLGIFHSPDEGYYDGGQSNTNDILVWSVQPKPNDTSVGPGATFVFQFPRGFPAVAGVSVGSALLGTDVKNFQAITRPVITNRGRSMYWGVTRSQMRAWVGEAGQTRYWFNRPTTAQASLSRGSPPMQAVFAPVALTSDISQPVIFGGSASTEFARLNYNFSDVLVVKTTSLVKTEARVSPDDSVVYYVEYNGILHQASTADLMDTWVYDLKIPIEGEFALKTDGTTLYIADVTGYITAFRVADTPTEAPSKSPSRGPTLAPSATPSRAPENAPSPRPTLRLSSTSSPSKSPLTSSPSVAPTGVLITQRPIEKQPAQSSNSYIRTILVPTAILIFTVAFLS